jgi:hypothetical protein
VIPEAAILSSLRRHRGVTSWLGLKSRAPHYRRDGLRYASDTTDRAWASIEPHLPPPASRGRARATKMRDVVDAIFYMKFHPANDTYPQAAIAA